MQQQSRIKSVFKIMLPSRGYFQHKEKLIDRKDSATQSNSMIVKTRRTTRNFENKPNAIIS